MLMILYNCRALVMHSGIQKLLTLCKNTIRPLINKTIIEHQYQKKIEKLKNKDNWRLVQHVIHIS
jgi:hypothetical protein